jgi:L-asparaginase
MKSKNVLVIHTGGTISMSYDPIKNVVHSEEKHPLQKHFSLLPGIAVEEEELFNYPSPHITPSLMLSLFHKIKQTLRTRQFHGVVITHGTDTLEETAYLLDLIYDLEEPIVLTGAMKSSNEPGSDGPLNFIQAIRVAASKEAKNKGVLVVFHDEIHTAKQVTKVHTSHVSAFKSVPHGPIGTVTKNNIYFHYDIPRPPSSPVEQLSKKVLLLKAVAGMENEWVEHLIDLNPDGIVFEAFGLGNLPNTILPSLQKAAEKNIPVVITSRCLEGMVDDLYHYPGGGRHLKELGFILAKGLSGPKARLKLMVALELCANQQELHAFFNDPL